MIRTKIRVNTVKNGKNVCKRHSRDRLIYRNQIYIGTLKALKKYLMHKCVCTFVYVYERVEQPEKQLQMTEISSQSLVSVKIKPLTLHLLHYPPNKEY